MDVVDRYLRNVRAYLPTRAQDDFVAELRENIRSQVEDREARLGRPLTEEERIAILRAHGRPMLVAGAYRSDGRRLVLGREVIGPDLFPFYRLAVLGVAAVVTLTLAIGGVAAMIEGAPRIPFFRTAVVNLTVLVGIATVAFAILDAHFRRTAATWDPRRLPAADRAPPSPTTLRLQAVLQLVGTVVFLWLWLGPIQVGVAAGAGTLDLRLGPGWRLLALGLTLSTALSLVGPVLTAARPSWRRHGWVVSLFANGAFIALAIASMWGGTWFLAGAGLDPGEAALAARRAVGFNRGMELGLGITLLVTALSTVFEVVRGAWREYRRGPTG